MAFRTVTTVCLLVSGSLGGILNQRKVGSANYSPTWNISSTLTSSSTASTVEVSSSTVSSNYLPGSSFPSSGSAPSPTRATSSSVTSTSPLYFSNSANSPSNSFDATAINYYISSSSTSSGNNSISGDQSSLCTTSTSSSSVLASSGPASSSSVSTETNTTSSRLYSTSSIASGYLSTGTTSTVSSNETGTPPTSLSASALLPIYSWSASISAIVSLPYTASLSGPSTSCSNSTVLQTTTNSSIDVSPTGVIPPTSSENEPHNATDCISSSSSLPSQSLPRPTPSPTGYVPSNGSNPTVTIGGYIVSGTAAPSGAKPEGTLTSGTGPYSGLAPFPLPQNATSNSTSNSSFCGGATVNIPDATLNWWYSDSVEYPAATFSALYNYNDTYTGWTLLEATTTFDVATALAEPAYSSTTTFNTYINSTVVYYYEYTTPPPDYVSTEVITQAATVPLNTSSGSGQIPADVMTTPDPASTVLPGPSSDALTALANTPFVYFTEFAIDSEKPTKVKGGLLSCVTSRQFHTLQSPFALYYGEEDPEGQSQVTGDVPDEFLDELSALRIPLRQLKLGTYTAEPTLLVVVEEVYAAQAVLAEHTELTESALALPSPKSASASFVTLSVTAHVESSQASLLVPSPTSKGNFIQPTGVLFIAHTEQTQASLLVPSPTQAHIEVTGTVPNPTLVPFTAVVGQKQTTLLVPSNSAGTIVTTIGGSVVTAKEAIPTGVSPPSPQPGSGQGQQPPSNGGSDSGGIGVIVSAIQAGSGGQNVGGVGSNSGTGAGSASNGGFDGPANGNNGGASGSGSGSGTNNNPPPPQQNQDLSSLFSAIQQAGQSAGLGPQATAGIGSGSSIGGSETGNSGGSTGTQNGGSNSGSGSGQSGSNGGSDSATSGNLLVPLPVVYGGVETTIKPSSNVVFDSQTISPGGPAVTISGTPVSLGPSGIVIGTVTHNFAASPFQAPGPVIPTGALGAAGAPAVITFGGATITQAPVPIFVVDGQTVGYGNTITVNNKAIAVGAGGVLLVNGATISEVVPGSLQTFTAAGETFTASSAPAFVAAGDKTLLAGGPAITVDGTQLSLAPSASALIIDGSVTSSLATSATGIALALTVGSDTLTANAATQFLLGSKTILTPGGRVTISGTTVILDAEGSVAVINGVSQTLSPPIITPGPLLTFGGTVFEANLGTTFEVDGQELTPGGVITADGTTISLADDASLAVINGVTQTLGTVSRPLVSSIPTDAAVLAFGGTAFTANSGSTFVISGLTLTPGGIIALGSGTSATTISLDDDGTADIVTNGNTLTTSLRRATDRPITAAPLLTIDGQTLSAGASGAYIISGQTLVPGGSAITFTAQGSVETVSLDRSGNVVVSNGVTSTIAPTLTITAAPELTVDGQIITPVAGSGTTYLISGKILTPGGSIVFNGPNGVETVSLSPDGKTLVEAVSGAVTTSALPSAFGIAQTAAPVITIGGRTFTALPGAGPDYLLPDGQTLRPGGPALTETIAGSVYIVSLSPSATVLVIEDIGPDGTVTKTEFETLFPATITRSRGTATVTTNTNAAPVTTQGSGSSSTGGDDSVSLQGTAASDKKIGISLLAGAAAIVLLAVLP